jgi:hypothetical protein
VGEITLKVHGGGGRAEGKFIIAAVMAKEPYYFPFDSQSEMLLLGSLKIIPINPAYFFPFDSQSEMLLLGSLKIIPINPAYFLNFFNK